MTFSLTVSGSSSALPTKDRFPTAHVLNVHERLFLVDCGEGTQIQLRRLNETIKLSRLDNVFISHLHGDHVFGLFGLMSTLDLLGRKNDLNIYGPPLLGNVLDDHLKYFGENMAYKVIFHAVDPNDNQKIYEDKNVTVETIPLKHRIPTCGYLFRERMPPLNINKEAIGQYGLSTEDIVRIKDGEDYITPTGEIVPCRALTYYPYMPRSYAFCSDTTYSEQVAELIQGVDLLYHEATFLDEMRETAKQTGHSTAKQAAEIAKKADVGRLLIGHFSSRYDDSFLVNFEREARSIFPNTEIAEEGKTYQVREIN
ncbi:MAG: ribonuclease Z [Prevotellaceae bacterium]|jgi:ribonuclease Z|nr:ribonuclease Z [Prevotellaceae bacterium]